MAAMCVTAAEASAIISVKYPDLTDEFDPRETKVSATPPRPQARPRLWMRPTPSPHPKHLKLMETINQIADRNMELLYPSMYTSEDCSLQEEDPFTLSVTPLRSNRADRLSSMLHVRTTPSKKSRRGKDVAKRPRPRHTDYTTIGLKHKILRLCGGTTTKSSFSSKYMSLPG